LDSCCGRLWKRGSRYRRSKVVTIGIGFVCNDAIVLCADTEVRYQGFHKYYEHKITRYAEPGWIAATTYAGNPDLMKAFDGKFRAAMKLAAQAPEPIDLARIQDAIETVLGLMDVVDSDPDGLHLLSAIAIPGKEMKLVKSSRKIVGPIDRFDYVGVGDSSLLRYLTPLLVRVREFNSVQARNIGIYLTLQARTYVDGCGGDTDVVTVQIDGRFGNISNTYRIDQRLLFMQHFLGTVASDFFDTRRTEEDFNLSLDELVAALKRERKDFLVR
jgi:hypothetical protein